jgi:hypothetical protein
MREIKLYKAEANGEGVKIIIDEELPRVSNDTGGDFGAYIEELDSVFNDQAGQLFDALYDNLPGGTLDRLLWELLQFKANYLTTSFKKKKD